MKVYGPSLAMTDDWEQRITQLGLTKTTHEYAVYQLLSTALGWSVWKAFLPGRFADHKLLPHHPSHTAVNGCYDPACACKATTSDVGYSCSTNSSMLSPAGQTVVSKSLFSAVYDCPCSGGNEGS